ncbi:ATP-binding protein [Calothrix membranacea FACHB-236]|nr:ATP-binding protein [Calothrix membranacea FACHB-236]
MTEHQPVPHLDLAPKLCRPLSLWNPLDYLRLLYWVIYFPQALRWYIDTFGSRDIPGREKELLSENIIIRNLLIQALVFIAILFLVLIKVSSNWLSILGIVAGVFFGILWAAATRFLPLINRNRPYSSSFWGLGMGVLASGVGVETSFFPTSFSSALGLASGATFCLLWPLLSGLESGIVLGVSSWIEFGVMFSIGLGIELGIKPGIIFGIASVMVMLRIDNWLLGLLFALRFHQAKWEFSHITPFALPFLSSHVKQWLRQDWEIGLHNVNQILAYTLQSTPVVNAVNQVLEEIPSDKVICCIVRLVEAPFDWYLVRLVSNYENKVTKLKKSQNVSLVSARTVAAGFWHLHNKQPTKATEAFALVRSLLYGEEIYTLAATLAAFHEAKELSSIAAFQIPLVPQEPLLRPIIWKTITSLRRVVEDVQFVNRSVSRSARSLALNRALGELTNILNQADTLPQAEGGLIVDIAQNWKESLLQIAGEVGEVTITKPVVNPYIVGDPVQGNLFVGREDIIRQLEELWMMGHQLQSVVLYGHRRMGKTSILVNAANSLGSGLQLVYVNLLRLGDTPQGVGEVLMAITDEISQAVNIAPPADADLLNLPYRTFERYLKQVEAQLEGGLIIALDEFEKIEELIEAGKIPQDFMGFLRGLVQMSSKVAFAFAGLHTLEEMTADYFQPFFASVIPIPVGFLTRAATRQILANPGEDFLLDYTPEALDEIYALTSGQPYLVQLLGFQLVRRYNDFVFEQGRNRNPVFTMEDVAAVINDSEFFKRGRYYFDGVWGQAVRGADGQQAIIQVLAPHPDGLSLDALAESTGMGSEQLQAALGVLMRHDVVAENEGRWRIIVELFRRWVLQKHHR